MKLYIEDDNGQKIEVTPLRDLGSETDIIILMSKRLWTKEGMEEAEEYYSNKLGKRVVIIDGAFDKILGITEKDDGDMLAVLEKQIPKWPTYSGDGYADGQLVYDTYECPNCGKQYEVDYDDYDFCPNCGQKLDMTVEEEDAE